MRLEDHSRGRAAASRAPPAAVGSRLRPSMDLATDGARGVPRGGSGSSQGGARQPDSPAAACLAGGARAGGRRHRDDRLDPRRSGRARPGRTGPAASPGRGRAARARRADRVLLGGVRLDRGPSDLRGRPRRPGRRPPEVLQRPGAAARRGRTLLPRGLLPSVRSAPTGGSARPTRRSTRTGCRSAAPATPEGGPPVIPFLVDGPRRAPSCPTRRRSGGCRCCLLDTNLSGERAGRPRASPRGSTAGDQEMRIRQEIVLGIGGLRALEAVGLRPTIRHLNEGHAAFVGLEKIRAARRRGGASPSRRRASARRRATSSRRTRRCRRGSTASRRSWSRSTSPPTFRSAASKWTSSLSSGRSAPRNAHEPFSMAVLALRFVRSRQRGLAAARPRLAAALARASFRSSPTTRSCIRAITNGVHRRPGRTRRSRASRCSMNAGSVDRAPFWRVHERLREPLVETCRRPARRRAGPPGRLFRGERAGRAASSIRAP